MPKAIAITAIQKPEQKIPAGAEFEASQEEIDSLIAKGAAKLPTTKTAAPEQDDQKPTGKQPGKTGAAGSK
ncbi:hypothetical protein SAMN05660443_0248 [Marinospirillum celere]|uniref:Uncharacterized protein n=1 Tax=Marinospirillum celere TaxID=1122252 RepID=A0A1I1E611_9GAMM|nr:hypothetical protein [Marinospirillum celere]SFB80718.1 hypothetical protein SAMN05660443_0248 [Marinospirillum celere]